ncbi:MAG: rhamnulokinase [Pirellulaceae bacterium]|jgi:rhamnulokinase|nr:rhamnulokinase [Pirellulaceae bacterium]
MAKGAQVFLAVDLGASSGRVVAGEFTGRRIALEEVSRFANGGVLANERLYWDLLGLWQHVKDGLRAAGTKYGDRIVSVGVDTWGVDFGLLNARDELLGNPVHYRDRRTEGILEDAFQVVPRSEIFAGTGLQFMPFNTLFQLFAMRREGSPLLDAAHSLLMMPDLFHWLLSGEKSNEYTDASTTQFFDPQKNDWAFPLLDRFELPSRLLRPVSLPGTRLGPLRASVAQEMGGHRIQVVLPGTHDTASAVMAVPASSLPGKKPNWCYISSGTWSLMGIELPGPVVTDRCRELNFTNEGGVGGTIRLLKNIAGLWLVQQCRACWQREGRTYDWDELTALAQSARPLTALIHPDDPRFVAPDNMPAAIRQYCEETGQAPPDSDGAVIRCALESLALRYRMVIGWLEQLNGGPLETIHIVGGGTQNRLLCQMAADACDRRVVAGPIEATAIGNVMMQAVSNGDVASIAEAREVIRTSFAVEEYVPAQPDPWHRAYDRFVELVNRAP